MIVDMPTIETLWHKCHSPFFSRRTIDGGCTQSLGQTWRRKVDGRWQYRQDAETTEDYLNRQW